MSNRWFADISSNNGPNYNAGAYASAGHLVIGLKATEGDFYTNPYYASGDHQWARDSHRHNVAVWHYMFARPEHGNPHGQVKHFWDVVQPHFRRPGDRVVIDLETGVPRDGAAFLREADAELHRISGTHPMGYTYISYFTEGACEIASRMWWIAAYGPSRPGNSRWSLGRNQELIAWQLSDGRIGPEPHHYAGIGQCDSSILNPSFARDLRKQLKRK